MEGGLTESRSKESVESDLLHHSNKGEIVSGERMQEMEKHSSYKI